MSELRTQNSQLTTSMTRPGRVSYAGQKTSPWHLQPGPRERLHMATRNAASRQNRKKAPRVAKLRNAKLRKTSARRASAPADRPLAPVRGADRREVAGVQLEIGRAGAAR